jgi:hypothetical protein
MLYSPLISSQLEVNLRGGEAYEEEETFDVDNVVSRKRTIPIEVRPRAYCLPERVSNSSDRYVLASVHGIGEHSPFFV